VSKKPFNWVGFSLIFLYILGVLLFCLGIYHCATFPQSEIVKFFGGKHQDAIFALSFFGGSYLIIGGIAVTIAFIFFAKKMAFSICPNIIISAIVVSKPIKNIVADVARTRRITSNIITVPLYFVVFKFSDGTTKELRLKRKQYKVVSVGDVGILTYKEFDARFDFVVNTLFIDFQRQS